MGRLFDNTVNGYYINFQRYRHEINGRSDYWPIHPYRIHPFMTSESFVDSQLMKNISHSYLAIF